MSKKEINTVEEWDALEAEKRKRLQVLRAELDTSNIQRGDLLIKLGEGNDSANQEITALEKKQKGIRLEIESIEAVITAIPTRRDISQADEIEASIVEIEKLDFRLSEIEPKIDEAIEAFVLKLREYFDVLSDLYDINPQKLNVRGGDSGIKDAISFWLHKSSLFERISIGSFRDYRPMIESPYRAHRTINTFVEKMRGHAKALRGTERLDKDFCRKCYGRFQYDTTIHLRVCSDCGAREE